MAAEIVCPFCGQFLPLPAGATEGNTFSCPRCAGSRLRVLRNGSSFSLQPIPTASCAVCGDILDLPNSIRTGDLTTHCNTSQKVEQELGAFALTPIQS
ncbi:MAG: hypothetical protein HYT87_07400 [Nitrospirae bacterium]|nr:hypothetical protein [Nitrospirota bacterium]